MDILTVIKEDDYSIMDNSIVIGPNQITCSINLKTYPELIKSVKVTKQLIHDSVHLSKKSFCEKYQDELLPDGTLNVEQVYYRLRNAIVDEKIPIAARKVKKKKSSRKNQVKQLLDEGYSSPSQIAEIIGAHPSYISTIIRKLKNE